MLKTTRAGKTNKIKVSFGLPRFYKEYIKNTEEKYHIDRSLHRYIVEKFWTAVRDYIIYEHGEFYMGYNLGSIRVKRMQTKMSNLKYNYGHYRKTGEKLYHLNEHTNEFYYKFYWSSGYIKNKKSYTFTANRKELKRKLSAYVIATPQNKLLYY